MAEPQRVCEDVVTAKAFRSPSPRLTSTSWPKSLEVGCISSVLAIVFPFSVVRICTFFIFKAKKHMGANGSFTLNVQVYSEG